ncbi:hypothetical protein PhCBS80983_g00543 [Powellomyces hirtus]|uniref:Phospholipase C n=1 Tax=Powellomyces hirtus TaxID=109895 RepID=A0A507EGL4_9FUNG|nr:hypothetical protein PhCBS80983_g00543 [Powellomyces hirtus]
MRSLSLNALAVAAFFPGSILGFDTGPHNDMVRNAFEIFGYSREAGMLASVTNWWTDMYAFSPNLPKSSVTPAHISQLEQMHCNNLYSIVYGANYITQHVVNTRAAVQDAVRRKDTLAYLAILGTSVHTYQDFYAHSNWANLHLRQSCDCYDVKETFFSELVEANGSVTRMIELNPELTGWGTYEWLGREYPNFNTKGGIVEHGDYCNGVNKDSYVRPWFEETYSYAFASTLEWIYNVEKWAVEIDATNATLNAARSWVPPDQASADGLQKNFDAAFEVSYSATQAMFGESDGHWKGQGSGSISTFAASVVTFSGTETPYTNLFLRPQDPVYQLIVSPSPYTYLNTSVGPTGDVVPNQAVISAALESFTPYSALPSKYTTDLTAVVVRTTRFTVSDAKTGRFSDPDPWAAITIGGFEIKEAPMRNQKDFRPYWTAIKFVSKSATSIPISYKLNDAATSSSFEQIIPITGTAAGTLEMTFTPDTKVVAADGISSGVYSNYSTTFISRSLDGSSVELYVDARPLTCGTAGQNGTFITFCPNTAYGEMGVFGGCDGSRWAEVQADSAASMFKPTYFTVLPVLALLALAF